MANRIVIDPITRIEGHLRIEAAIDGNNTITEAYSAGTMVRGIENILKKRDPRDAWAFAQRICGVCTTVHAIASIRAVEDALGINIPKAANLMRNMIIAQQYIHDHVMHFYILHALDFVDVVSALKADPKKTSDIQQSISGWPKSSPAYFAEVQKKVQAIVDSGQLSLFSNGYWGHPAYKLPPEINLLGVAHYLECLDWQSQVTKIHTIFGGKNPHPNFVVGGVPLPIDMNSDQALNAEKLAVIADSIKRMNDFVDQVYLPDLLAVAPYYLEYAAVGEGLGNFLAWGEFPEGQLNEIDKLIFPRGVIVNRDLKNVIVPDPRDAARMKEFITHSWYKYSQGDETGLFPWEGETVFNYTGPRPPYEYLNVEGKYSWLKSPRWNELPMEVGPLARVLILYATGHKETVALVNAVLEKLRAPVSAVFSTLGRTAARAIETKVIAGLLQKFYDELVAEIKAGNTDTFNDEKWEPRTWPKKALGFGYTEAPRGALGHWVVIENRKIKNYQIVVPTTWNASPRDHRNQAGAYEASLVGTRLANPEQPLEILRTLHSFDPCLACAVHLVDTSGKKVGEAATGFNLVVR
ncbi:MAG: nickel-dependent hydrogenase large subunit [Candidatus Saccharicenans sp.]|jgi:hydrogenase large subunit|nr:nickel-dependent hydrogenase large subunit [Candidatus Saccharicenans sp.]MDH7575965.1 nickel-dependent hydrogenase large subunit [Candidatus Saccharicenans sp.]